MLKDVLPPITESGQLGIMHLKRFWQSHSASVQGKANAREHEYAIDIALLNALGLGLSQTISFICAQQPDFCEFEQWVENTAGKPEPETVSRFNAEVTGQPYTCDDINALAAYPDVFSPEQMAAWYQNGYIVLKQAVSKEQCKNAEQAIWHYLNADPDKPHTWYHTNTKGIMVDLIQHPALSDNRNAMRVRKAFSQLWQTEQLWCSAERCSFHPPQLPEYPFCGPDLHWDIAFHQPLKFSVQGLLYLTDTCEQQGAFSLVPGFHKKLEHWLKSLPSGADPNQMDLHSLGASPLAGHAGDLILWHQWLPHGSRPNTAALPRMVQYINMLPMHY